MRILISVVFSLLLWQTLNAQSIVQGQVKDTEGEVLPGINILIFKPNTSLMIAFAVSDGEGRFQIRLSNPADSLDMELRAIHCKKLLHRIANISQTLQFVMEYDVKQLEAFTVKAAAIEKRGDTISYLVSSFASKEDRAIEDVLRRMPGIEIEPGGRILYQGLPLLKFYVEGLDLMNGRYGVISKNLPHGTVSTVEIMENHQPIRILEERVYSQQASLNLKLKREITTTGTANLGSGFSPFLWDIKITPMIFTKNFQVLASYQTNNSGNDVSQQMNILTIEDFIQNAQRPNEQPGILSIQAASLPAIEQKRYLDNNIHLFNFNGLLRMNGDFQLRSNLYYVSDRQQQEASLQRTLYTPTDTLTFIENLDNKLNNNYLMGEFTLSRNVKKNYLNNVLKIQSRWDKQMGTAFTAGENIKQTLKNPLKSVSNELRSVNAIGTKLVEFQSYISYDHSPHSLEVSPGQFEMVLNQNEAYDKVLQQIELKRFYADHSASFSFGLRRFSFTPRVGIAFRRQTLESNIYTTNQGQESEVGSGFNNQLEGRHMHAYFQTEIEYKKSNFTINTKLPISWQEVDLKDATIKSEQNLKRLLFDPSLSISYKFSNFWAVRGSWSYSNRLGNMDRVHYGYILNNYRSLGKNEAPLSETSRQYVSASLSYRNPISSFFNSISTLYSVNHDNLIYSSLIQDDGTSIIQASKLPNTSYSQSVNAQSSKYFSSIKSTISMKLMYNQRKGKSLINETLFNTTNQIYSLNPGLNVHFTEWLHADYELDASYIKTYVENDQRSKISLLRHKFNFFAFPTRNQLFSFSSEYYNLVGNNHFFADLLYRYTFTKQKIDLEFRWNNIFNTKNYSSFQSSSFMVYESTYLLRPSQVFLSVRFSF